MENFHLPLPEQTRAQLRTEAKGEQVPAIWAARGALAADARFPAPGRLSRLPLP